MPRRFVYVLGAALGERILLKKLNRDAEKNYKKFFGEKCRRRSEREAIRLSLIKWEENLRILEGLVSLREIPIHRKVKVTAKLPITLETCPLCWTCAPLCPLAPGGKCVGLCSPNWREVRRIIKKKISPILALEPCKHFVEEIKELNK